MGCSERGCASVLPNLQGTWHELRDNMDTLTSIRINQTRAIAQVIVAVARGDLSRSLTIDASGEMLELKHAINCTVAQLRTLVTEVSRVASATRSRTNSGIQAKAQLLEALDQVQSNEVRSQFDQTTRSPNQVLLSY